MQNSPRARTLASFLGRPGSLALFAATLAAQAGYAQQFAPLPGTPSWSQVATADGAHFGHSVSSAGDINGDGFDDLLVGSPFEGNDSGLAQLFLGSSQGLEEEAAWSMTGDEISQFGFSVASAGDVNGDGFDDIVIGLPKASNGESGEGLAYVLHGSATGLGSAPDWIGESNRLGAHYGASVASAGDVNNDGFDDVIVGADSYTNGHPAEGRAFLYLGSVDGLSADPDWVIESNQVYARLGASVAGAGDVNGDGFDDVIVGAPTHSGGAPYGGASFVYLGSGSGPDSLPSWSFLGQQPAGFLGHSVSGAGDIDQDGYDDFLIGAPNAAQGFQNEGVAMAFMGSVSGPSMTPSWSAAPGQVGALTGLSVAAAGDVNGDGFADVVVGSPYFDDIPLDEGRLSVFLGSALGLDSLSTWQADSDQTSALLGFSVAGAGDFNGDGFDDLVAGAPEFDTAGLDAGLVMAFYGAGPLMGSLTSVSSQTGGTQVLSLDAGPDHANELYVVLGSLSGTLPGFDLSGAHMPLNIDAYTLLLAYDTSLQISFSSIGLLDPSGRANAQISVPAGLNFAGLTANHAFFSLSPEGEISSTSNPLPLHLTL